MPRTVELGEHRLTGIGLGTNRLTDTPENRSFLEAAVHTDLNFVDTAHLYAGGESEAVIGATLAPFGDELVVATKGGYEAGIGIDGLRAELELSYERLQVDTITLYYLHRAHPDHPIEESMRLLQEYRDAGRITHIGLSAVGVEQIEEARSIVPIAAVQNAYNLSERDDEVVDHCAEEGIAFVAYYPLHGDDTPAVTEIAERHGATPNQVKLAWLLKRSPAIVPIPGTLSVEHLKENLGALDLELSDDEFERLSA